MSYLNLDSLTTIRLCNFRVALSGRSKSKFLFMLLLLLMILTACASSSLSTKRQNVKFDSGGFEINEKYGIDADTRLKFDQAVKLMDQEQYSQAIELLLEVTGKTDKHSGPYVNLGIAYLKLGKVQEAEKSLLSALEINPVHPVTQNEMGMVYRRTGRFSQARKTYENILATYPQFLPARKNIGILCDIFIEDLNCAIEHYQAYLDLKPADESVKLWLADLNNRVSK